MPVCGQKLLAMYEAATEAQPANTDLLRGLFVALVRVDNFTKQQQVCARTYPSLSGSAHIKFGFVSTYQPVVSRSLRLRRSARALLRPQ
jgi:hypothetical protein